MSPLNSHLWKGLRVLIDEIRIVNLEETIKRLIPIADDIKWNNNNNNRNNNTRKLKLMPKIKTKKNETKNSCSPSEINNKINSIPGIQVQKTRINNVYKKYWSKKPYQLHLSTRKLCEPNKNWKNKTRVNAIETWTCAVHVHPVSTRLWTRVAQSWRAAPPPQWNTASKTALIVTINANL